MGREPTPEEIGAEMGATPQKVREILKISQEPVCLETPIGEEEDSQLGDFIEDVEAAVPHDAVSEIMRKEELNAVLDWARETAKGEPSHMGLATVFFPLGRVEKIFLDEATELIPSISEQARTLVGDNLDELLSG